MKKDSTGKQDRKLSVHVKLPEDAHPTTANEITVVNPDTEEELLMGKLDYLFLHPLSLGVNSKRKEIAQMGQILFFKNRPKWGVSLFFFF